MFTSIYIAALLLEQCCVWTGVFVLYGNDKTSTKHCALDNKRSHAVREPDSPAGATRPMPRGQPDTMSTLRFFDKRKHKHCKK